MMRIARPISGMTPAYSGCCRDARAYAARGTHPPLARYRSWRMPSETAPASRAAPGDGLTRNRSLVGGPVRNMRRSPIGSLPGRR